AAQDPAGGEAMTFARAFEDAPATWGVGRLVVDEVITPWPVSQPDIDDEAESQAPRLAALGVEAGDIVLVVAMLSEAIHAVPLEKAAGKLGALYSSADASTGDAFRCASLIRQLEPVAVVGVNAAVLDGLAALGRDVREVFGSVAGRVATADEPAHAALDAAGLSPRRWVKLGPTSAWETEPGGGVLAYDAERWHVDDDAGEIVITNGAPRLTSCTELRTGVRGRVRAPGAIEVA
ncbi:MAG: hypothetical protein ACRDY6_14095, partial [Acidimicrobiia bacterium]